MTAKEFRKKMRVALVEMMEAEDCIDSEDLADVLQQSQWLAKTFDDDDEEPSGVTYDNAKIASDAVKRQSF